eukprot:4073178-Pleurochrysis_carterae.AAC.1
MAMRDVDFAAAHNSLGKLRLRWCPRARTISSKEIVGAASPLVLQAVCLAAGLARSYSRRVDPVPHPARRPGKRATGAADFSCLPQGRARTRKEPMRRTAAQLWQSNTHTGCVTPAFNSETAQAAMLYSSDWHGSPV